MDIHFFNYAVSQEPKLITELQELIENAADAKDLRRKIYQVKISWYSSDNARLGLRTA